MCLEIWERPQGFEAVRPGIDKGGEVSHVLVLGSRGGSISFGISWYSVERIYVGNMELPKTLGGGQGITVAETQ